MSLLRGEHFHIFKFDDSDPEMPYGTYVGTEKAFEFACGEFEKVVAKHPGAWFATCERDCLEKFLVTKDLEKKMSDEEAEAYYFAASALAPEVECAS